MSGLGVQYKRLDGELVAIVDIEKDVALVEKCVTPNFTRGCDRSRIKILLL